MMRFTVFISLRSTSVGANVHSEDVLDIHQKLDGSHGVQQPQREQVLVAVRAHLVVAAHLFEDVQHLSPQAPRTSYQPLNAPFTSIAICPENSANPNITNCSVTNQDSALNAEAFLWDL